MTNYNFGNVDEPDTLTIQGKTYTLQGLGLRAMRKMLMERAAISIDMESQDPRKSAEAQGKMFDLLLDTICSVVIADQRDGLREHLNESVSPKILNDIAKVILRTDLDPTQPGSSSDGSSGTSATSTDGAVLEVLTLNT